MCRGKSHHPAPRSPPTKHPEVRAFEALAVRDTYRRGPPKLILVKTCPAPLKTDHVARTKHHVNGLSCISKENATSFLSLSVRPTTAAFSPGSTTASQISRNLLLQRGLEAVESRRDRVRFRLRRFPDPLALLHRFADEFLCLRRVFHHLLRLFDLVLVVEGFGGAEGAGRGSQKANDILSKTVRALDRNRATSTRTDQCIY